MKVPHLLRDLSWNLVGSHRMLVRLLTETKVEPGEGEREGDSEPHTEKDQHGTDGDSSGRVYTPDEEVEDETSAQDDCRVKGSRLWAEVEGEEQGECTSTSHQLSILHNCKINVQCIYVLKIFTIITL